MRIRGLALSAVLGTLSLGIASTAQAGTQIRLVPQNVSTNLLNPLGHYLPGEVVNVNAYLVQTPAGPNHLLRLAKLHFDATSPSLAIGSIAFQPFSTTGHYVDASLTTGPAGIAAAYFFANAANLGPNPTNQLAMLGIGTPALVASFTVTMPASGAHVLDVMNAAGANNDVKAAVTYGFGCAAATPCANGLHPDDVFAVTTDRPGAGLTGGTLALTVNTPTVINTGEPSIPPINHTPCTHPLDNANVWRSSQQVIRIRFTANIAAAAGPLSPAPAIEIRELTPSLIIPATGANFAGGVLNANLNVGTNFAFSVEVDPAQGGAPRILRIIDSNPAQIVHRKWYTIQNVGGWAGAPPFRMDYRTMVGDFDNNGFVNAIDVGNVNGSIIPGLQADNRRADIDGNRFINAIDTGAANGSVPTGGLNLKPAGHP